FTAAALLRAQFHAAQTSDRHHVDVYDAVTESRRRGEKLPAEFLLAKCLFRITHRRLGPNGVPQRRPSPDFGKERSQPQPVTDLGGSRRMRHRKCEFKTFGPDDVRQHLKWTRLVLERFYRRGLHRFESVRASQSFHPRQETDRARA